VEKKRYVCFRKKQGSVRELSKCHPSKVSIIYGLKIPMTILCLNRIVVTIWSYFDVLLTVHLSIILVINQLNAQNLVL